MREVCGRSEMVRFRVGGAVGVGGERDTDMAIVENRVVRPVGAFELIQALRDQKTADAVACHEGKLTFEEVEAAERRKLVEHQQELLSPSIGVQALGQTPSDLIEDEAHE